MIGRRIGSKKGLSLSGSIGLRVWVLPFILFVETGEIIRVPAVVLFEQQK